MGHEERDPERGKKHLSAEGGEIYESERERGDEKSYNLSISSVTRKKSHTVRKVGGDVIQGPVRATHMLYNGLVALG